MSPISDINDKVYPENAPDQRKYESIYGWMISTFFLINIPGIDSIWTM